jgi:hypothetical protein
MDHAIEVIGIEKMEGQRIARDAGTRARAVEILRSFKGMNQRWAAARWWAAGVVVLVPVFLLLFGLPRVTWLELSGLSVLLWIGIAFSRLSRMDRQIEALTDLLLLNEDQNQ